MSEESFRTQIATYLVRLDALMVQGRRVCEMVRKDPGSAAVIAANRAWQQECGATIHQLSRGSKAHWLARSFSEAFLMRSTDGQAAEGAAPEALAQRLLGVLEQAVASLSRMGDEPAKSTSSSASHPRFGFVHNAELRPVVEQAYTDSRQALEQGGFATAMRASCGILEAIVTDALQHKGLSALSGADAPAGNIFEWPFESRLALAESLGLIRGGWARLPAVARTYRDENKSGVHATITERDARTAGQVLNVVMRDLNPGR